MRINPIVPLLPNFNARLKDEYTAYVFYTNCANWCANMGYKGFEAYFRAEAADELTHAQSIMSFVADWGNNIYVPALPDIPTPTDVKGIFEAQYELEALLYEKYNDDTNEAEKIDRSAYTFFLEKVGIQRASVAECRDNLDQLARYSTPFEIEMFEQKYFEID